MAAIHPMIIDTKNRGKGGTAQRPTGHGVVPHGATTGPGQMYSPIHECPCTDKWPKKISSFSTLDSGTCNPEITDAQMCFDAAVELGLKPVTQNKSVSSATAPPGCAVTATAGGYEIVFNSANTTTGVCGKPKSAAPPSPPLSHTCSLSGSWLQTGKKDVLYQFNMSGPNSYQVLQQGRVVAMVTVAAPSASAPQGTVSGVWGTSTIPAGITTYPGGNAPPCSQLDWGNGVTFALMPFAKTPVPTPVPPRVAGTAENLINVTVDIDPAEGELSRAG